jgi:hypothetical protein
MKGANLGASSDSAMVRERGRRRSSGTRAALTIFGSRWELVDDVASYLKATRESWELRWKATLG